MFSLPVNKRILSLLEIVLIFVFAFVPLFSAFPFRINIFLSWEGAYRMSHGEIPFKDFGLPMGYGYWIIPAIFFKIFGPAMITLIKAQVFINIISGLAFVSILKSLRIEPVIKFISVFLYLLSFSFFNFWPWYNHTVIVFEFIGIAFLFKYLLPPGNATGKVIWLMPAAFFIFLSFFTKQDGGGLALLLALAMLLYYSILNRSLKPILFFSAFYILTAVVFIAPLLHYGFGYWFNHGQPPHNSRLSIGDFASVLLGDSQWLKFYFLLFVLFSIPFIKQYKVFIKDKRFMLLLLLCLGVWVEALLFQVTSYIPPDNNIFFHSFSFMFILTLLYESKIFKSGSYKYLFTLAVLILFWWSDVYWKYIDRVTKKMFPEKTAIASKENVVSRKSFTINLDTTNIDESKWIQSSVPVFRKINMPASTVNGINRLINTGIKYNIRSENSKVLNMTELTPLSYVMGFKPETGLDQPLWYHLGVGMFNKQKDIFINRISHNYYDLILFEFIPTLNNFYPFEVRDSIKKDYQLIDSFLAPRRPTNSTIEVYVKKTL